MPDAQANVEDAEAVIAVVHALVAWLAERHDAGEPLPVADTAPLAADRAAAARHGLAAELTDPDSGERAPARERLAALLDVLAPVGARLGGERGLARARAIVAAGGIPARHRAIAAEGGLRALAADVAGWFAPGARG